MALVKLVKLLGVKQERLNLGKKLGHFYHDSTNALNLIEPTCRNTNNRIGYACLLRKHSPADSEERRLGKNLSLAYESLHRYRGSSDPIHLAWLEKKIEQRAKR